MSGVDAGTAPGRGTLHVAPHPGGGWVVEADRGRIPTSLYDDLAEATADAEAYAESHGGWRVVVHDGSHAAADI